MFWEFFYVRKFLLKKMIFFLADKNYMSIFALAITTNGCSFEILN